MYWILYVTVNVVEDLLSFLVQSIPLYYPAKVALLLYLMIPKYEGAKKVYDAIIAPHLSKVLGDRVDEAMKNAAKSK